jgi:hypothetical protein
MRNFIAIAVATAAIHLAITAYLLSLTIYTRTLQIAFDVISFPLVYLEKLNYRGGMPRIVDFDWVPVLVPLNSLLWGVVLGALCVWVHGRGNAAKAMRQ